MLLKLGLDLTVRIEQKVIAGKAVHSIGAGALMVCLAEQISAADAEALGQGMLEWHAELAPAGDTTCVFRDSAFADDVAKTNLTAILQQRGLQTVRSLYEQSKVLWHELKAAAHISTAGKVQDSLRKA